MKIFHQILIFTADYFISVKTWEQYGWISRNPDWNYNGYWNYIKLKPGVSIKKY